MVPSSLILNLSSTKFKINPFQAIDLFLYPLKTSENLWFSDAFWEFRKRPVAWNGSSWKSQEIINLGI